MDNQMQKLVKKLKEKSQEMELIYSQISELAMASSDHDVKFYSLTELGQHFGIHGISNSINKLEEKLTKE